MGGRRSLLARSYAYTRRSFAGLSLRAFPVFDANCCGQFIARTAQVRIVSAEFVHEAHEGVGNRIELALAGVLGERLSVLQ